jgi:ABC-2 type transport system permease protein
MPILTLAAKDLRLLLRDARSAVILLVTPLLLILVLGLALGEGFGEKPDERLRISVVNLDHGLSTKQPFPEKPWSEVVIDDLSATQDIRLEIIADRAEAEKLVARGSRPAVLIFERDFSDRMNRCSFLTKGDPPPINPLGRDGVRMEELGLTMLADKTQPVSAAVIDQVTQVTLLRVVIPWMIGRAFERVGDESFMAMVAERLNGMTPTPPPLSPFVWPQLAGYMAKARSFNPVRPEVLQELDPVVQKMLAALTTDQEFLAIVGTEFFKKDATKALGDAAVIQRRTPEFQRAVHTAFTRPELMARVGKEIAFGEVLTLAVRKEVGPKVQEGVADLFSNYNFHAKTWAELVKSDPRLGSAESRTTYRDTSGTGFLNRGAVRYQILVPSYTVMFAFFLVLSVGWLFVAERKHGTLVRLRAAPLTRAQILMGKLLPCLAVSLAQGFFLLGAGRLLFGMTWGSRPDLLVPVVVCTSVAAVGLAVLVASIARTETQVAVYGTLLVLVLGGVSGSLMPRDLMPEKMKAASLVTPHAWALDAYSQLLANPNPDPAFIATACGMLLAFGAAFTALAWWRMDLE